MMWKVFSVVYMAAQAKENNNTKAKLIGIWSMLEVKNNEVMAPKNDDNMK